MSIHGVAELESRAPSGVLSALQSASQKTGISFDYLIQQAQVESSLNPSAKAKTSSASGLFQFIESTWLGMVKNHGAKYGLQEHAAKISPNNKVSDPQARKDILDLRFDPEIASKMAAEFAGENQRFLKQNWGGEIGSTELYLSHFLGAGSAAAFLKARDDNPLQDAATLFPKAAKANHSIFYDSATGQAKSLEQVYARFDSKFSDDAPLSTPAPTSSSIFVAAQNNARANDNANRAYTPAPLIDFGRSPEIQHKTIARSDNFFASLLQNPADLMMMTDLELPFFEEDEQDRL